MEGGNLVSFASRFTLWLTCDERKISFNRQAPDPPIYVIKIAAQLTGSPEAYSLSHKSNFRPHPSKIFHVIGDLFRNRSIQCEANSFRTSQPLVNSQAGGMAVARPYGFEIDSVRNPFSGSAA